MSRRTRVVITILGIVVVIAIYVAIAPENAGSGRLIVLHRFLPRVGVGVTDAVDPPSTGTFLLVADERSRGQDEDLLRWVEAGGRLVVTDPGSELFSILGASTSRAGVFGTSTLATDCVRPEILGVARLEISSSDHVLSVPSGAGCFAVGSRSYAEFVRHGSGVVVLLGGFSFLDDQLLREADNAVFATSVLGGGPVTFGPPRAVDASASPWALLPSRAKTVVWGVILAVLVFAVARGRRLGRPVPEDPLSPIRSSELVDATARLYRRAHATAFCADVLRRWTADRLARRLGIAPDVEPRRISGAIARSAGVDPAVVEHALAGPDPTDDQQLVALGRELETMSEQIGGTTR
jgi:hypothetical protein